MWTGDGRVFFYNPSSRTSVWERPEDLLGRTDVDKMVSNPPDALAANKEAVAVNKTPQKTKRTGSDESDSEDGETPAKKAKKDENCKCGSCFCPGLVRWSF